MNACMKLSLLIIIFSSFTFLSCKEKQPAAAPGSSTGKATVSDSVYQHVSTSILQAALEGKWKETAYPFRLAEFKGDSVKFTEEGVVDPPQFLAYRLSPTCPFQVNNMKNASQEDVFLLLPQKQRCEIIKVMKDTMTLSGWNPSAQSDYRIIYKKEG